MLKGLKPKLAVSRNFENFLSAVLKGEPVEVKLRDFWSGATREYVTYTGEIKSGLDLTCTVLERLRTYYSDALPYVVRELMEPSDVEAVLTLLSVFLSMFSLFLPLFVKSLKSIADAAGWSSLGLTLASMFFTQIMPLSDIPDVALGMVFDTNVKGLRVSVDGIEAAVNFIRYARSELGSHMARKASQAIETVRKDPSKVNRLCLVIIMRDLCMMGLTHFEKLRQMAWSLLFKLDSERCKDLSFYENLGGRAF